MVISKHEMLVRSINMTIYETQKTIALIQDTDPIRAEQLTEEVRTLISLRDRYVEMVWVSRFSTLCVFGAVYYLTLGVFS